MIHAFFWKEWREQRTVSLAILAFGTLAMFLTAQFADPVMGGNIESGGARELMGVALAFLSGVVCGAILLADEKEVGTLEFLDTLPCRRRSIWLGKALVGLVLALGQCAALALVAIAIGCIDERLGPLLYGLLIILVGLMSFAWGMFGGALSRSTLGAVFLGSIGSFVSGIVLIIPFSIVFGQRSLSRGIGLPIVAYYATWVGIGLLGAAFAFTAIDRRRVAQRTRSGNASSASRKPWFAGTRALTWLSARQAVFIAIGAGAASLLVGAVMLVPDSYPLFVWPGATLALGVLAGVTTVGEEQVRGVARFWAERRLPLGRLWIVKTRMHFAIAAAAALLLFLLIFAASPQVLFRSRLISELRPELGRFLLLSLVYGFVVGHLAGMLFRKTVVAGLVATVTAASLIGLIFPSVIGGGAAWWQVWAPAAVLLITARSLLYPWATDRILHRGPVLRTLAGTALALGITGIGIGYRVLEIPEAPDRLDESGYVALLPVKGEDEGGRWANSAASQYRKVAEEARTQYPNPGLPAIPKRGAAPGDINDPLVRVARNGWNLDAEGLNSWLDKVFATDWTRNLDEVAARPLGLLEDPRDLDFFSLLESVINVREMAYALRARGLQRQRAGDDDAYARLLRGGLAVARTARNGSGRECAMAGLDNEEILLGGLDEWLGRVDGKAELLRQVLADLLRHEREMPTDATGVAWAEHVILRNTMERVSAWLPNQLGERLEVVENRDQKAEVEANLIAFAWTVPWERARRDRLVRLQTVQPVNPAWLSGLHRPLRWRVDRTDRVAVQDRRGMTLRRLAALEVALRLYQLDHGRSASNLADLVPEYMPYVSEDPYTEKPFGYRVSKGEVIRMGMSTTSRDQHLAAAIATSLVDPLSGVNGNWIAYAGSNLNRRSATIPTNVVTLPQFMTVAPGDGVLWSAGPDGQDGGGRRTGSRGMAENPGDDWIVVIPLVSPGRK